MEITTTALDSYCEKYHHLIWGLSYLDTPFGDLEKGNQVLHEFESAEDIHVGYGGVINEIRKNLITVTNIEIIYNYKSYINKKFEDLIHLLAQKLEALKEPTDDAHALYLIEDEFPYKSFESLHMAVSSHYTWMKEDCFLCQEQLTGECEREIKIRTNQIILPDVSKKEMKLIWKGTPAQFAFIINLFKDKGYIDGLTPFGERNAKILLAHFEIEEHKTTPESLGRCFQQLKKDELPINKEDAAKFQRIPHRNELKK